MEWKEKVKQLPDHPGVYLFRDKEGKILYVGKASSLKKRVSSYLSSSSPKTLILLKKASALEFILTSNENEALLLEFNFIKEYRPRYNIRLKDDKKYPYITVTWQEEFPRIFLTREVTEQNALYFGPYTNAGDARTTLRFLRKIFPFKTCSKKKIDGKPCLNFSLRRCPGPCKGDISREDYLRGIRFIISFLKGETTRVMKALQKEMRGKAEKLEFEEAARLRDCIYSLEKLFTPQAITSESKENLDIIGVSCQKDRGMVTLLRIREGRWIGEDSFPLSGVKHSTLGEILYSFILQYYSRSSSFPEVIITESEVEDKESLEKFLRERSGRKIAVSLPGNAEMQALLKNANTTAKYKLLKEGESSSREIDPLLSLQRELNLPRLPYRIEGYDISQLRGEWAVGSRVVFEKGVPLKEEYRKYRIKSVQGVDDYGMIKEIIRRRTGKVNEGQEPMPDLILVDGGRGQMRAVLEVLRGGGINIPVVGLAKGEEKIYVSQRRFPLLLPRSSPALRLLMRVRDEAHRVAHSYHLHLREKSARKSAWGEIPGVGEKLLPRIKEKFSSLDLLSRASVEEISMIPGVGKKRAMKILQFFEKERR